MSNEKKESRNEPVERGGKKTLEVTVHAQAGAPAPIRPDPITLNDSILRVVWRCPDLPRDARLQIVFRGDSNGPFSRLESKGNEVIGWVQRTVVPSGEYAYEARSVSSSKDISLGTGTVAVPVTLYPPPGPPDADQEQ